MSNWVLQLIKLLSLGLIDITPEPKSRFWFSNDSYLRIYIFFFFLVNWDQGTNSTRRNEYKTRSRCLLTKLINVHIEPMVARDQGFAVSSISISYPLSSPPTGLLPVGTLSKGLHLHILLAFEAFLCFWTVSYPVLRKI